MKQTHKKLLFCQLINMEIQMSQNTAFCSSFVDMTDQETYLLTLQTVQVKCIA